MTQPPPIADPQALHRNRRRAGPDPFLHRIAQDELHLRLAEVNRRFTRPAIVTGLPALWADFLPGARLIAEADMLELTPGAHDLVIHAMSLHWAADPVGQLIQCRRALVADGLLLAVAPGGQTLAEARAVLAQAEADLTGGLSPRVLPMAEIRDLGAALQRAGLALPVADSVTLRAAYRDLRHFAADLRAMGEGNALAARARRPAPRALFAAAESLWRAHFPAPPQAGTDRLLATFELIFLTGWAPDPRQPQPLRPGSASHRLADALDTSENPLSGAIARPEND